MHLIWPIRQHIRLIVTRAQIPGSRLHAGSQTRTLHADRGRGGGPSDGGSERPARQRPTRQWPMRQRSMRQRPMRQRPCDCGPCSRPCARKTRAPPADARARECAPAQPRLSAASLTTGAGERLERRRRSGRPRGGRGGRGQDRKGGGLDGDGREGGGRGGHDGGGLELAD
jgi:hypothetical protein